MSNFLQRVAATVVQPRAKLQPMSGSIFAPATLYSSAAEPFQPEVSSQTAAPRHHGPLTAPRYDTSSPALADHPENKDSLFPSTVHEDSSPTRLNRSPAGQPLPPASRNLSDSRGHTHPNPFVEDSAFETHQTSSKSIARSQSLPAADCRQSAASTSTAAARVPHETGIGANHPLRSCTPLPTVTTRGRRDSHPHRAYRSCGHRPGSTAPSGSRSSKIAQS